MNDEYTGPERRTEQISDERWLSWIRTIVREELHTAMKDGHILNGEDQHTIRAWLRQRKSQDDFRRKLVGNTIGWLVIVGVGGLGLAVWEAIKTRIYQP